MTSLYAPDVFIKDKVEALAQQLGLELPHQEQWDFIQSAESLDLQAAPGSGKTSLVGLKLALLGRGWNSPTRGICVLSHTNTAKDEITNRLTATPAGRRLLQYPHFIGTIQSFANTFFALPALRARSIDVQTVDDSAYEDAALRMLERHPAFRTLNTSLGHRRKGLTHMWEDMEARLGWLILTAAAALDDLAGDAWDTVDERLRFRVARVAALAGHEPQLTRSTLCAEGPARQAVRALPRHPLLCGRTRPSGAYPASPVGDEWETSGR